MTVLVRAFILFVRCQVIGQRWQELTPEQVEYYKKKAEEDMKRYKDQMEGKLSLRSRTGSVKGF